MATYYNKQKTHNTTKFRNWTIYATDEENRSKYNIYYIDSEWNTVTAGSGEETANFTNLQTAFNDGSTWTIKSDDEDMTMRFTCIIVRLSDRKVIKCFGDVGFERLADNSKWTCTDITGQAWYEELRKLRLLGNI